jgi:hypothetical protein
MRVASKLHGPRSLTSGWLSAILAALLAFNSIAKTWSFENTEALGELHEGLGFPSTGVEDADVVNLEPWVGYQGPSQVLEDGRDCFWWRGVKPLFGLRNKTHGGSLKKSVERGSEKLLDG